MAVASQLEAMMLGRQPRVEDFRDGMRRSQVNQRARCLLAAMACVGLDTDGEEPLFIHRITIRH